METSQHSIDTDSTPSFSLTNNNYTKHFQYRVGTTLSLIFCLAINAIHGSEIGKEANKYPNQITPSGWAFSIWAVIYTLLILLTLYQIFLPTETIEKIVKECHYNFALSNVLNGLWVVTFAGGYIWFSTVVIASLLCVNVVIQIHAKSWEVARLSSNELVDVLLVDVSYSLYNGWLSVATIVNVTVGIVSCNGGEYGKAIACLAAAGMVLVAMVLNLVWMFRRGDPVFPCVFVWAAFAIRDTHIGEAADDDDKLVANVCLGAIAVVVLSNILLVKLVYTRVNERRMKGLSFSSNLLPRNTSG